MESRWRSRKQNPSVIKTLLLHMVVVGMLQAEVVVDMPMLESMEPLMAVMLITVGLVVTTEVEEGPEVIHMVVLMGMVVHMEVPMATVMLMGMVDWAITMPTMVLDPAMAIITMPVVTVLPVLPVEVIAVGVVGVIILMVDDGI